MTTEHASVAIIGGGMTGITAAIRLAEAGHPVDLYEARDHLGGLSDAYGWDGVTWDRFYHVVLSTDERLLRFLRELGLGDRLFWRQTKSGFYGDGKLVSMSSMLDFLAFPFLSLWQKFRLGTGILRSIAIKDADRLDRLYVSEWLTRVFGRRVYERIWDPLLRSKLGEARHQTSAAFIWATIARLYGARSGESKTEQMGHVRGGYATILAAVAARLDGLGVRLHLGAPVDAVAPRASDGAGMTLRSGNQSYSYDKVLLTVPAPEVLRLTGRSGADGPYWKALADVRYLGVLCLFVVLDRGLSPYYVTNLLDTSLPFTGIIEATNIVDPSDLGGHHLVYLPKYVSADDPLVSQTDEAVAEALLAGLRKVHPELPAAAVLHTKLFRESRVQPLQEVNYLDQTRGIQTPIPGLYLANSTMLYNSTLNNNAAVALAESAAEVMNGLKGAAHG
jgi:protoporphyrinogen oxidase